MSYVGLKHLLTDLALEAVRGPAVAGWAAVTAAYGESATPAQPAVPAAECLRRAAILAAPHGWMPVEADLRHLITAGLFSDRGDDSIVLSDRFLPSLAYLRRQAPRLLRALTELRGTAASPDGSDEIHVGAALFNAGLFFECHEWLEGVWRAAAGTRKECVHGIVQAAAAFYHYEKANLRGCRTLLGKGRHRLAACPAPVLGIDLARFEDELARWAAHLAGGPRPDGYPRLRHLTLGDPAGNS